MRTVAIYATIAQLLFISGGCSTFAPQTQDFSFERHALSSEKSNVRVTVAVLSASESERYFALPLESEGVQAIWIKVENRNGYGLYIVPRSTDPQYFSAYETAFMNHRLFASHTNTEIDEFFQRSRIHLNVAAHATNTGFLFTNRSEGAKFVNIEMVHDMGAIRDGFFFQLPNGSFDYEKTKPSFAPESVRDLTLVELRHVIETLPCCTTDDLGSNHGDPMNFVIIGSEEDVLGALTRQGWDPTHVLAIGTAWRTIGAFLSGDTYLHSPVSSLYFFGRRQDIAMQKARSTIHRRNHLRLWRVPYTYLGRAVWIGQISRDIGVHFTINARFFVTHKIDPDVDSERSYLVQDLIASDYLYALAYAKGAVKASQEHPAANLTGDPYFSDGLRAVMLLSSKPVPEDHIDLLQWEMPSD